MGTRIVVGVDGSGPARRALEFAVDEAERRRAAGDGDVLLEVVHAYPGTVYTPGMELGYGHPAPPPEKLAAEAMQQLLAAIGEVEVPRDLPLDPIVVADAAAHALLEKGQGADLVVVGTRGHGGFRGLLLGSTSIQVVTHAPCPVVVVPPPT